MGLFDSSFQIDEYVRKRMMEMDDLKNRELFKEIIVDMMLGIYHHADEEYQFIEERVFREVPFAAKMPDVITGIAPRQEYDVTDKHLYPMDPADLEEREILPEEMLSSVREGKPFFLYTCFIAEDFLELKKLAEEERTFHGIIENEYGETAADFILRPNEYYRKLLEELYPVTRLNHLPWRSINSPYLYKLFDVYVVRIEEWDEEQQVKRVTVEFEEYAEHVRYDMIPLWNATPVNIMANAYPQPAVERGYYEHYLYRSQFKPECSYLLRRSDWELRGIRWQDGDLYILCDGETPGDWEFLEFHPEPNKAWYTYPPMGNGQKDTFSQNMIEHYGQRIKTRTELIRLVESFPCSSSLELVDVAIQPNKGKRETYSMEEFIEYEFRSGNWDRAMVVSFRSKEESYLVRDIMSFLMTELQHFFPEYECMAQLV